MNGLDQNVNIGALPGSLLPCKPWRKSGRKSCTHSNQTVLNNFRSLRRLCPTLSKQIFRLNDSNVAAVAVPFCVSFTSWRFLIDKPLTESPRRVDCAEHLQCSGQHQHGRSNVRRFQSTVASKKQLKQMRYLQDVLQLESNTMICIQCFLFTFQLKTPGYNLV